MIDWNQLWLEARRKRTWQAKTKDDWNRRSAGFTKRNLPSSYVRDFVSLLELHHDMTVLDMGSGPGTIALPIANQVKSITAVDFSPEMLEHLQKNAQRQGVENIRCIEGSWLDDWHELGIDKHDLVIASRSLAVDDLQGALYRLNEWAVKRVVIGDRVGNGPFDPALFKAVGREFISGPDYIYTLNILHQMGIYASVEFIKSRQSKYESKQSAVESCIWMMESLTAEQEEKLKSHLEERLRQQSDGSWILADQVQPVWAFISWDRQ